MVLQGRAVVVGMINVGQQVTLGMVTVPARTMGAAVSSVGGEHSAVDEVLADIVGTTQVRLVVELGALQVTRRRVAMQNLEVGLVALWADVAAHVDEYRALMILQTTRPDLLVAGLSGPLPLGELPVAWAVQWLNAFARLQDAAWDTPVTLLARLVVATLNGLITDLVCRPDATDDTRQLLKAFAYELAQHSIRSRRPRPEDAQLSETVV